MFHEIGTNTHQYGANDVLELTEDASKPEPGEGQVLIEFNVQPNRPLNLWKKVALAGK